VCKGLCCAPRALATILAQRPIPTVLGDPCNGILSLCLLIRAKPEALLAFAYNREAKVQIEGHFPSHLIKNRNLFVIEPPYDRVEGQEELQPRYLHTLANISRNVFASILPLIPADPPAPDEPNEN
jgi:hypothetical protein